jgi:hypothetical protein
MLALTQASASATSLTGSSTDRNEGPVHRPLRQPIPGATLARRWPNREHESSRLKALLCSLGMHCRHKVNFSCDRCGLPTVDQPPEGRCWKALRTRMEIGGYTHLTILRRACRGVRTSQSALALLSSRHNLKFATDWHGELRIQSMQNDLQAQKKLTAL